jgi:hypothetical protein
MSTPKGKLFQLASTYKTYCGKKERKSEGKPAGRMNSVKRGLKVNGVEKNSTKGKGEHFDEGQSISLTYSFDEYPEAVREADKETASAMNLWDNDHSEAFYVESFEAEEFVEAPYREVSENSDDEKLDKIVTGFSKNKDEFEDMKEDEAKLGEMEEKIDGMFDTDDDSKAMEVVEYEGKEEAPDTLDEKPSQPTTAAPTGSTGEGLSYDASDEEFARDIGAILQGQKVYDADQKKAVGKDSSAPPLKQDKVENHGKPAPKDDVLDPTKNEHRIFEKIAQSMAYANSYDLGAIALEEKFELMQKEIEKEDVNKVLQHQPEPEKKNEGIQYAEVVDEKVQPSTMSALDDKFNPGTPLDAGNGGRIVKVDDLMKGDLILAASSTTFGIIDGPQGAQSIAGLYIGNKKVLTKSDAGSLEEKALETDVSSKGVWVALRPKGLSAEKGNAIVDMMTKLRVGPDKSQVENWVKISAAAVSPHPDVCNASSDKTKCNAFAGKIQLGTQGNDSFLCAESIINVFERNQLGFVQPLGKEHNGSLTYFGHLKNRL